MRKGSWVIAGTWPSPSFLSSHTHQAAHGARDLFKLFLCFVSTAERFFSSGFFVLAVSGSAFFIFGGRSLLCFLACRACRWVLAADGYRMPLRCGSGSCAVSPCCCAGRGGLASLARGAFCFFRRVSPSLLRVCRFHPAPFSPLSCAESSISVFMGGVATRLAFELSLLCA